MSYLPVNEMVKDAEALARQFSDGSNPIRDTLTADVICHIKALASEYERLQADLRKAADLHESLRAMIDSVHPRVFKLATKGNFICIGEHEPYYLAAYAMIRDQEMKQGSWTEEDRLAYAAAQLAQEGE